MNQCQLYFQVKKFFKTVYTLNKILRGSTILRKIKLYNKPKIPRNSIFVTYESFDKTFPFLLVLNVRKRVRMGVYYQKLTHDIHVNGLEDI